MVAMHTTRWLMGLGLLGIPVYALNFQLGGLLARAHPIFGDLDPYRLFLVQLLLLAVPYLAALFLVFHGDRSESRSRGSLWVILFFAGLYRFLLLPAPPALSTDIYRYLWDGRVQALGINPYKHPPESEALAALRDQEIYAKINRPWAPTIYPAGAQLLFHGLHLAGVRTVTAFKAAVAAVDMGSLLLLALILMHFRTPVERVLVYAWHPLAIYELANNGHLDGFMLFFVLLSFWLMLKGRLAAALASLALATAIKLYPLLFLPALLRRRLWPGCLLFAGIILALYLPYMSAGTAIAGFLPEYFGNPEEGFNLGIKAYILAFWPAADHLLITALLAAMLLSAFVLGWRRIDSDFEALRYAARIAGLNLLLASGALHPWYLVLLIPFLALFPSAGWFYFSFAVALSYLTYLVWNYTMPAWIRHVEYIPLFMLLVAERLAHGGWLRAGPGGRGVR